MKKFVLIKEINSVLEHIEPMTPMIIPFLMDEERIFSSNFSFLHVICSCHNREEYGFLLRDIFVAIAQQCSNPENKQLFMNISEREKKQEIFIPVDECVDVTDMAMVLN